MKTIYDDQTMELECECGRKLTETIGRLKNNPKITCACGITQNIDSTKLRKAIETAQKALDKFKSSIPFKF